MDDIALNENATNDRPKHLRSADTADEIIALYRQRTRSTGEPADTVLVDLLADLHHWAVENNIDFAVVVERGDDHWAAETPDQEWCPVEDDAWEQAELPGHIPPHTPNVTVTAGHRQSCDDPDVFGPFETAEAARAWVLAQYQSQDFDQTGCWVTYNVLRASIR